jgi:flavin-dependent dehydrogenase
MVSVDLVIVGAGPAGLATALHLVRLDPAWADRMVILEKASHPRHKPCAGGLTYFAQLQLRALDLELEVPYVYVEEARLEYRGRRITVRGSPVMAVTQRSQFDASLAAQARRRGLRLNEHEPVLRLERDGEAILVHTHLETYRAQAIVGADGTGGIVRRWLTGPERPAHVARAVESLSPATGTEPEFGEKAAQFDFAWVQRDLKGYAWSFPSLASNEPRIHRGLYDSRAFPRGRGAPLRPLLTELVEQSPGGRKAETIEGYPLHWFTPWSRVSGPHVLLAGDAAGSDVLFGEGIGIALAYGAIAAISLTQAFAKGRFSFSDYRWRLLFSPLGGYLLRRGLLAQICYPLSSSDLFMQALWTVAGWATCLAGPTPPVPGVLPSRGQDGAGPPCRR